VATVDQHGQLDGPRPAEVGQGVQGGPDRPPGVEDVVDQDDDLAGQVERQLGVVGGLGRPGADVVAVHGDVKGARRDLPPLDLAQLGRQPPGQGHPASVDADHHQPVGALVPLDDLVGDPDQRPLDVGGVQHHRRPGHQQRPQPTGRGGVRQHSISSWLPSRPHRTGP
jgi:hypothetical protein